MKTRFWTASLAAGVLAVVAQAAPLHAEERTAKPLNAQALTALAAAQQRVLQNAPWFAGLALSEDQGRVKVFVTDSSPDVAAFAIGAMPEQQTDVVPVVRTLADLESVKARIKRDTTALDATGFAPQQWYPDYFRTRWLSRWHSRPEET